MKTLVALFINLIAFVALRYVSLIYIFLIGYASSDKYYVRSEIFVLIVFLLQMIFFYLIIRKWPNKLSTFLVVFFTLTVIYILDFLGFIPLLRS
jgi:hypothetical protein